MIHPRDRRKTLTNIRNLKMARSAHAFVRGSTERFYAWLESKIAASFQMVRRFGFAAIAT
jgi:uncharacterized protein (DUF2252 family)